MEVGLKIKFKDTGKKYWFNFIDPKRRSNISGDQTFNPLSYGFRAPFRAWQWGKLATSKRPTMARAQTILGAE
jgi:hypothetical protein